MLNFIKEDAGLYNISKPITKKEIIDLAKYIISIDFERGAVICNSNSAKDFFILQLSKYDDEVFCAIFLDSTNRIICFEKLFTGTIDNSIVHPRGVVKKSLTCNAASVIFAHNHPSGRLNPSLSDKKLTLQLSKALALIDVKVLDHIIVAGGYAASFTEKNINLQ